MRITFRLVLTLLLTTTVLLTGCSRKKPRSGPVSDTVVPEITNTEPAGEIPLTGAPFDQQGRTKIEDANLKIVYFGYDSFQIAPEEVSKIEEAGTLLTQNGSYVMIVAGHCDERGSNEYNMSLGEQRALAIRSYLVNLGIAAERIQTRSYGEEQPVDQGHDESAWRQNRRGEFLVYK
jgi:peptidoglycan-associated lipoprotein